MENGDNKATAILTVAWGSHCRFVGDDYVSRIQEEANANKPVDEIIKSAKGGDNFDWVESIKILYQGVQLINGLMTLYFAAKKVNKLLSKGELLDKARQEGIVNASLNPAVASKVETVIEKIVE